MSPEKRETLRRAWYLRVADLKGAAGDDAALLLGPGCSVAVGGAGVAEELGVWAAG